MIAIWLKSARHIFTLYVDIFCLKNLLFNSTDLHTICSIHQSISDLRHNLNFLNSPTASANKLNYLTLKYKLASKERIKCTQIS